MTKLVFQYWGAGISLGIYGTKAEVQRTAYALFNFNATDSEPIWLNEDDKRAFAYILTDWDRLKKGYTDLFVSASRNPWKGAKHKKLGRNVKKLAAFKADQRLETITPESFLDNHKTDGEPYQLGFVTPFPNRED